MVIRLRCSAPTGVMTPDLHNELAARKEELLSFLKSTSSSYAPAATRYNAFLQGQHRHCLSCPFNTLTSLCGNVVLLNHTQKEIFQPPRFKLGAKPEVYPIGAILNHRFRKCSPEIVKESFRLSGCNI
jgi:hypothetical protein